MATKIHETQKKITQQLQELMTIEVTHSIASDAIARIKAQTNRRHHVQHFKQHCHLLVLLTTMHRAKGVAFSYLEQTLDSILENTIAAQRSAGGVYPRGICTIVAYMDPKPTVDQSADWFAFRIKWHNKFAADGMPSMFYYAGNMSDWRSAAGRGGAAFMRYKQPHDTAGKPIPPFSISSLYY